MVGHVSAVVLERVMPLSSALASFDGELNTGDTIDVTAKMRGATAPGPSGFPVRRHDKLGHVLFGPYVVLPAGRYLATLVLVDHSENEPAKRHDLAPSSFFARAIASAASIGGGAAFQLGKLWRPGKLRTVFRVDVAQSLTEIAGRRFRRLRGGAGRHELSVAFEVPASNADIPIEVRLAHFGLWAGDITGVIITRLSG